MLYSFSPPADVDVAHVADVFHVKIGIIGTVLNTLVILFWATLLLLLVAIVGAVGSAFSGHPAITAEAGPLL